MSRALARSLSLLAISCNFLPPLGRDSGQEARVPTQSAKTRDKDYQKQKTKKKKLKSGVFFPIRGSSLFVSDGATPQQVFVVC
jgi:hypothetical protein